MTRTTRFLAGLVMLLPSVAYAQDVVVEGEGHKIGDTAVLHPVAGVEAGVISNVFFQEDAADPTSAGIFRVLFGASIRSMGGEAADDSGESAASQRDFDYRMGLNLRYDEYLSSNESARSQRSVGIAANAGVTIKPGSSVSFFGTDNFTRDTRPPNFESSDNLERDVNRLRLGLRWRPVGRTLSGTFEYLNTIDRFEDSELSFANRIQHQLRARADWRYLPITRFYLQATQGLYSSLGDGTLAGEPYKNGSFPLDIRIGADTAITEITTLNVHAGWGVGFYEDGASYNTALYGIKFGFRYSPLGRLRLHFERRFDDSINANFYGDYIFKAGVKQQVASVVFDAEVGYIRRKYEGIPDVVTVDVDERSDNIFTVDVEARYHFREWFAALASYKFAAVDTDFRYSPPDDPVDDDPSFARHEFVAGVRAAF